MLNKKIVFLSILSAIIMITIGFSSAVAKNTTTKSEKIVFETKIYTGLNVEKKLTELTLEEAEEIKKIINDLETALIQNDVEAIAIYKTILQDKGIIDEKSSKFIRPEKESAELSDDISNSMCYFHAMGVGLLLFPFENRILEAITEAARNIAEQTDNPIAAVIIALVVFILLFVLFCLPVMIVTHLVPVRIMMPSAKIQLKNGKMWTRGTEGFKKVETSGETIEADLSYFTGITISTLPISVNDGSEEENDAKGFMFVSGFAFKVEPSD